MNLNAITRHKWFAPAVGAALTVLCGLIIQGTKFGEQCENASYDNLYKFGFRAVTNKVVLIMMDDSAYNDLKQFRDRRWDRSLHARMIDKLADDQAKLVVFDVAFESNSTPVADAALADAMRRQGHVVLMQKVDLPTDPHEKGYRVRPVLPILAHAAAGSGVAKIYPSSDEIARQHWPFPSPDQTVMSLPWKAAELSGATLSSKPTERWLRYYGANGGWIKISYQYALSNESRGFFSNKVVFIGQAPEKAQNLIGVDDNFRTPCSDSDVGGVEILATMYLNLMRGDWLSLLTKGQHVILFALAGIFLGGGFCLVKRPIACGVAVFLFLALMVCAVCVYYFANYWFDWVGMEWQLPVALLWAMAAPALSRKPVLQKTIVIARPGTAPGSGQPFQLPNTEPPDAPDYQLCDIPFGSGAYGSVWLARNAIGQWQALKAVYLSGFGQHTGPYDREFNGISRYKPISGMHPGLLYIDFISQKKPEGYFYYVMELGDSMNPDWKKDPSLYQAKDLGAVRREAEGQRLPASECIRIGLALCEALQFLHSQGLIHRDIKPGNIIFVNNKPKLADVGLIAEIRPESTWVGTPAYMPPPPEPPGTVQADIYALGMVLYVISTGRDPEFFPGISTTLAEQGPGSLCLPLNGVILKACQPDTNVRYSTAQQMHNDLLEVKDLIDKQKA